MGKYASEQEIKERQTFTEKAKALGIDIHSIDDSSEWENPYRAQALYLLTAGKGVPADVIKEMHKLDKQYRHG